MLERILREAAARGEITSGDGLPLIARTGPSLVLYSHILGGSPLSTDDLTRIVDEILIHSCAPRRHQSRHRGSDGDQLASSLIRSLTALCREACRRRAMDGWSGVGAGLRRWPRVVRGGAPRAARSVAR